MSNTLKKVHAGDPPRIPAATYNRLIDVARDHQADKQNVRLAALDTGPAIGILGVMSFFDRKEPWYIGGLAFECQNCGRCCAGPEEGYVWLNEREIAAIAGFLGMPEDQLREKYVRRVGARFSLREHKPSHDCVFLEPDGLGCRTCKVYSVRPAQCRTWPYWPANLRRPEDWSAAAARCRGVNRGRIVSFNEIETRRIETSDD